MKGSHWLSQWLLTQGWRNCATCDFWNGYRPNFWLIGSGFLRFWPPPEILLTLQDRLCYTVEWRPLPPSNVRFFEPTEFTSHERFSHFCTDCQCDQHTDIGLQRDTSAHMRIGIAGYMLGFARIYLARSANLPEGLYILLVLISSFFLILLLFTDLLFAIS